MHNGHVSEPHEPLKQIPVRFPKDEKDRLARAAKFEGLTFAAYVRSAALDRLRQTERKMADHAETGRAEK